jgi:sugar phosphate permease
VISNSVKNARWWVAVALHITVLVGFMERQNLALAVPKMASEFGWSDSDIGDKLGLFTSAFYVGLGLSNIFLAPLVARFGPRRCMLTILVLWSLSTMLAAPLSSMLLAFTATRILLGVSEGLHVPIISTVAKRWFPVHERSRVAGVYMSGALLAMIGTPLLVVPIIDHFGWRAMFVAVGLAGLFLTLPFAWLTIFDTPRHARWLTKEEAAYIEAGCEAESTPGSSWAFLRNTAFWLALAGGMFNNLCSLGIITWIPTYFERTRDVPFSQLQYVASGPYIAGIAGMALSAWLGDTFRCRARVAGIGYFFAGASLYLATRAESLPLTLAFFTAGVFFQSAYVTHEYALIQYILPRESISKGAGLYNGVAILGGGALGNFAIGKAVSITGNMEAGLIVIVVATMFAGVVLLLLDRRIRY